MKKPLGVSDLIDAFSSKSTQRKVSSDDPTFPNVDSLKNKRRGSLQIQIDSKALAELAKTAENEKSSRPFLPHIHQLNFPNFEIVLN